MNKPIGAGDECLVIESSMGAMVGVRVKVVKYVGDHSKLGRIWNCEAIRGDLTTEYGGVGKFADFAQSWLKRCDDPTLLKTKEEEITKCLD